MPQLLSMLHHWVPCRPQKRLQFQAMRLYRTERIKNGVKFTCTRCDYSVSTLSFDPSAGNLRTQAATAINQHATQLHHEPPTVSNLDVEVRSWRS